MYDTYPIKTLARVLCFEDLDEARTTCRHYNITVKHGKIKNSSGEVREEELVCWRKTPFREPKDEEKNTTISLKPRKMIRTIESKLNGATRLAVCRGGGSFAQDSIPIPSETPGLQNAQLQQSFREDQAEVERLRKEETERQEELKKEREKLLFERQQQEFEEKAEHDRITLEMAKEQRRLQLEREKKAQEEARRLKAEAAARKRAQEEEARRVEVERRRREAEELKRLERLRQEEERLRKEQEKRRQEEIEAERIRVEKERLRVEAERRRQEKERRQEMERIAKERKAKEEQAMQLHLEWKQKVSSARKEVAWRRWLQKFPRQLLMVDQTRESLSRIGDQRPGEQIAESLDRIHSERRQPRQVVLPSKGFRYALEALLRRRTPLPIATMLTDVGELESDTENNSGTGVRKTLLLNIAIVLPGSKARERSLYSLVRMWLAHRLDFGNAFVTETMSCSIRIIYSDDDALTVNTCDAAIVVLLPSVHHDLSQAVANIAATVPTQIPCVALLLMEDIDGMDPQLGQSITSELAAHHKLVHSEAVEPDESDEGLSSCLRSILGSLTICASPRVERVSVVGMCCVCVGKAIWRDSEEDSHDVIMKNSRIALRCLVDSLKANLGSVGRGWPAPGFAAEDGFIRDYFGKGVHLPLDWSSRLEIGMIEARVTEVASMFEGNIVEAVSRLLAGAPVEVRQTCESMLGQRLTRRCLQTAVSWKLREEERGASAQDILYMPAGLFQKVVSHAEALLNESLSIDGRARRKPAIRSVSEAYSERALVVQRTSLSRKEQPLKTLVVAQTGPAITPPLNQGGTAESMPRDRKPHKPINGESNGKQPSKKRRRLARKDVSVLPSDDLRQSTAFTRKLEAILNGNSGKNIIVGGTTLTTLLRDAPDVSTTEH